MFNDADLFDFLGLATGESVAEKKESKKERKNDPKKDSKKAKKEKSYDLPIKVTGRNFEVTFDAGESKKMTSTEILNALCEKGIREAGMKSAGLRAVADGILLFGFPDALYYRSNDVDCAVTRFPVYVAIGECVTEVDESAFPNKSVGEISCGNVLDVFADTYPEYRNKDVSLVYDEDSNVISPFFNGKVSYTKDLLELPITIGAPDKRLTYTEADFQPDQIDSGKVATGVVIRKYLNLSASVDISGVMNGVQLSSIDTSDGVLYDIRIKGDEGSDSVKAKPKKAESMIKFPVTINVFEIGRAFQLTAEEFGQPKAKLEDVKKMVVKMDPLFASLKESGVWNYIEEANVLAVGFKSGKKG